MDKGVVELLWRGSSHLCIVCEWTVDPLPYSQHWKGTWYTYGCWSCPDPFALLQVGSVSAVLCPGVTWEHPECCPLTTDTRRRSHHNKCSFVSQPQISNISTSLRDIRTKILLFGRCEFLPVCLRGRKAGESLQVQRELSLGEVTMTGESFEFESELVLTNCLHTYRAKCAHSWRIDFPAWNLNLLK